MAAPTWKGWQEVFAAQNADVESTAPCLYQGIWREDHRDWIPQVYDSGLTWDICNPIVNESASLEMTVGVSADMHDLWNPVGEERTTWLPVQYPN